VALQRLLHKISGLN